MGKVTGTASELGEAWPGGRGGARGAGGRGGARGARAGVGERAVAGDWPGVGRRIERAAVGYLGDGGEEPESSIRSWLPFRPSQSRP